MMTALYVLTAEYRKAAEILCELDLPPEVVADTLESLSGDLEFKCKNTAMVIRNLEVTAEAIKAFEAQQSARRKAIEKRVEDMKRYLADAMTACRIERVEGPGITLSFRKSSAVCINEPGLIPSEFMRTPEPPPPAPDKRLIGEAIKAGKEVPGAHIEVRKNLQIA